MLNEQTLLTGVHIRELQISGFVRDGSGLLMKATMSMVIKTRFNQRKGAQREYWSVPWLDSIRENGR
jgi:hypothetical protein